MKLAGGNSTNTTLSGQLVIRLRNNDWREVCSGIGMNEASVACREMGFKNAALLKSAYLSYTFPSFVTCTGSEQTLKNCSLSYRRCSYRSRILCYNETADAGELAGW